MTRTPKRPRDPNQLAKSVVDIAIGDLADSPPGGAVSDMATLGRTGGLKGGRVRAEKLSPEERSQIAAKAARARWGKLNG